ncbi:MAG: hypothetical protein OIF55_11730 [Amphritea sp.]|nr:hypothetical protein [Amphritea sp.]
MRFDLDFINDSSPDDPKNCYYIAAFFLFFGVFISPFFAGGDIQVAAVLFFSSLSLGVFMVFQGRKRNVRYMTKRASEGIKDLQIRKYLVYLGGGLVGMVGFGLIPVFAYMTIKSDAVFFLFFWFLAIVSFLFFKYGSKKVQEYNEVGDAVLFIDGVCGVVGHSISGFFDLNGLSIVGVEQVSLTCCEVYRYKSDDKTEIRRVYRYRDVITPHVDSDLCNSTRISFETAIPDNLLPSYTQTSHGMLHWYVEFRGEFESSTGKTLSVERLWRIPVAAA